jgi:hypothetical protein
MIIILNINAPFEFLTLAQATFTKAHRRRKSAQLKEGTLKAALEGGHRPGQVRRRRFSVGVWEDRVAVQTSDRLARDRQPELVSFCHISLDTLANLMRRDEEDQTRSPPSRPFVKEGWTSFLRGPSPRWIVQTTARKSQGKMQTFRRIPPAAHPGSNPGASGIFRAHPIFRPVSGGWSVPRDSNADTLRVAFARWARGDQ